MIRCLTWGDNFDPHFIVVVIVAASVLDFVAVSRDGCDDLSLLLLSLDSSSHVTTTVSSSLSSIFSSSILILLTSSDVMICRTIPERGIDGLRFRRNVDVDVEADGNVVKASVVVVVPVIITTRTRISTIPVVE